MLSKIKDILEETEKAEKAFEALRDSNEQTIKSLFEVSKPYLELKEKCTGDFTCYVSILSSVQVRICYKLNSVAYKQSISISEDGIDINERESMFGDEIVTRRLHSLATEFYENFYLNAVNVEDSYIDNCDHHYEQNNEFQDLVNDIEKSQIQTQEL